MDYYQYVVRLSKEIGTAASDFDYAVNIPAIIDYAEQRIYRELDIMESRIVSTIGTMASSVRNFTYPTSSGTFIVVESMNAISTSGSRYQMVPVTKEWMDAVYPNTSTSINGTPKYFATIDNKTVLIGPAPDASYSAEIVATVRPARLSSANSSTFLTQYCPDLFLVASMVYASDDAQTSMWEDQYQKLMASAGQEQLRARYEGSAWTPMVPAQITPPRA